MKLSKYLALMLFSLNASLFSHVQGADALITSQLPQDLRSEVLTHLLDTSRAQQANKKERRIDHRKECHIKNHRVRICAKTIGRNGFIIDKPGEYFLTEDIVYNPKGQNPAIRISAAAVGNVTLNLRGKTLSQLNKSVLGINAIVVDPGLTNVTIKNGTITGFSNNGIQAGEQRAPGLTTPATITNFYITKVNAFNNGSQDPSNVKPYLIGGGGIVIYNAQDVILKNNNANENVFAGFFGVNVVDLTVSRCHFDNNTWGHHVNVNQAETYGFFLIGDSCNNGNNFCSSPPANPASARNLTIRNCTFDQNTSIGLAIGLFLTSTGPASIFSSVIVESCSANGTSVTISDPAVAANFASTNSLGMAFTGITGSIKVDNCQISLTSLTINIPLADFNTGAFNSLIGLSFAECGNDNGTLGGIAVTNCDITSQTFQNNSGAGVRLGNASLGAFEIFCEFYIANCRFMGNTNLPPADGSATPVPSLLLVEGLDLAAVDDVLVEDCFSGQHTQAAQNPGLIGAEFSYAAGFKISFEPNFFDTLGSTIFRRCVATGIRDTGGLGGGAFGFTTRDSQAPAGEGVDFVFESCIAENNSNGAGGGTGFDIFNLFNGKIINNYAEGNDIGILVSDFVPAASFNNIFSENVLIGNLQFGIRDNSALSNTNAYYKNQAKNNGANPGMAGSDTNFSGGILNTTGAPIRYWVLPNPPDFNNNNGVHGESLDNISINL